MNTNSLYVRKAEITDAENIYKIWADGWQYAYGKILSPEFLAKRVGDAAVNEKIMKFPEKLRKETDKGNIFLVLIDNDKVIGFVSGGVPNSPECRCDGELDMLYIDTDYIGCGIGKMLFQTFAGEMKKRGLKTFGLMCFSDNKSMGFYKKMGGKVTVERRSGEKFEYTMASFIEFNIDEVLSAKRESV